MRTLTLLGLMVTSAFAQHATQSGSGRPIAAPKETPKSYLLFSANGIGEYRVSENFWNFVMESGPPKEDTVLSGKDKKFVSWNDAQDFIAKLNELEKNSGYRYRLPTEAEWVEENKNAKIAGAIPCDWLHDALTPNPDTLKPRRRVRCGVKYSYDTSLEPPLETGKSHARVYLLRKRGNGASYMKTTEAPYGFRLKREKVTDPVVGETPEQIAASVKKSRAGLQPDG